MLININYTLANCWVIIILYYMTPNAVLVGAFGRANVGFGYDPVLKCFD